MSPAGAQLLLPPDGAITKDPAAAGFFVFAPRALVYCIRSRCGA